MGLKNFYCQSCGVSALGDGTGHKCKTYNIIRPNGEAVRSGVKCPVCSHLFTSEHHNTVCMRTMRIPFVQPEARDSSEASKCGLPGCAIVREHMHDGVAEPHVRKAAEPSPTASDAVAACDKHRLVFPAPMPCPICYPPAKPSADSTADEAKDGNHIGCGRKWSEHLYLPSGTVCPDAQTFVKTATTEHEAKPEAKDAEGCIREICRKCHEMSTFHYGHCNKCERYTGQQSFGQPPADATSLSLLFVSLGDSTVILIENSVYPDVQQLLKGFNVKWPRTIKQPFVIEAPFETVRDALDQRSVPRIEMDGDVYRLVRMSPDGDGRVRSFDVLDYDALSELAGKPLPVFEGGTWTRLNIVPVTENGIRESDLADIRVWRFTRGGK